ncbi:preprotein translocase subunit SecG [candidate division WWE3 bacterium CG09_land_8_20_14_0_10_47_33]|uniref:Protein-export membrane protein SecG n=1 Tax=candidate division WWE3 bacterium CG_4_9_14_0_2_um_filter_48_10 TaxID=1975078 RepID=A0A2M8EK75_UNCKA|nr:MAG: preprotein translocase subunit SecG [candidate division WWE3 bacterium CG09_land_8_20_14_0_10_47_33]PIZ40639.1 MAG: preprotein translocase subunit SecG [candidate division WWE3 bacterium CG_4_10_14_0_2_um_filter_47_8]PJC23146.1 MAG: preprotein translocase subunit SecG [candidate division WWE3 bacterium CG_4_9_14_0_2_um_filter_48_10]PJE50438.1 MAG: preprotein translocase subunit SecG [candidate division WWE3 bacterium CG10_big_fil_rev_8_21_14_0_10_48_23]
MIPLLQILQIVAAVFLIISILLQGGGAGLSSTFGGSGETFRTRRGVEKILFYTTTIIAVIFILTLLVNLLK